MKKITLILFIITIYYSIFIYCNTHQINSIQQVKNTLDKLTHDALVIFDVDETLIIGKDRILRKNPKEIINKLKDRYWNTISDMNHREYLDSIVLSQYKIQLIEPEIVNIINNLQFRNIRVIALTHMFVGPYHMISNMEAWRFNQLYSLGVDLSKLNNQNFIFTDLPQNRGYHPTFFQGILATARSCSKGEVLAQFIQKLNPQPSEIVFFDDLSEHVLSVEKEMSQLKIPCKTYQYTATEKWADSFDQEIASFQYEYLFKHKKWLDEQEVSQLMSKHNCITNLP